MVLIIDNYDSFTHNLGRYFKELGENILIIRNDRITLRDIYNIDPSHLVISPGPGTPVDSGISLLAINEFAGKIPLLGVCLGHQCIAHAFGAKVTRAKLAMHGKTSRIFHNNSSVFLGLHQELNVARYHSLIVDPTSISDELTVTAWTYQNGHKEILGIKHKSMNIHGVQFHPESVLTQKGHNLLKNYLDHP
ncbi:type 1 glutamine amidotransferase [Vibrio splendidus]|uniref:Aminodeoxychorismate/anthranilate synthase component II n=1 Tax=Vibrio lentus TaxID=136468 RepID=A0A4U2AX62_9VIBR|nr:aminodeoxychorismate/anthranilate synthase component II [Vibrio lentus]PHN84033.1 type 1 glutamine amidotransferase [Vibrio splendidus]MCC4783976.1 aminodeoxychorismate/anthranilate synthase component II [Vibrio lentus]MCC4854261.1 aminodeoxychorismate/anthranilate synthase component II [Vibrio lentus]OMO26981.1 anthranilate/aminodeoxychorismate synthase component II [Vibrio lentus]PME62473.1 anthranilate/aminodeoxychorismate synthase component II [Vibrio lentus]